MAAAVGEVGGAGDGSERKTALPVLLDWGLAKTLPESQRIAFSRYCACVASDSGAAC